MGQEQGEEEKNGSRARENTAVLHHGDDEEGEPPRRIWLFGITRTEPLGMNSQLEG